VLEDGRILLRARVWAADPKAAAHQHTNDGKVELEQIEQFISHDLADRFRIRELAYDPTSSTLRRTARTPRR
jgi:hypothetical protein